MITADGSSASGLLRFTRLFIMGKPPSLHCRLVVCFIETVLSIKLTLFSKPESTKVIATEKRRNVDDDKKPNKAQEAGGRRAIGCYHH